MVSCSEYDIKNQEEVPQSVDTSETETETFIAPDCAVSLPDIGTVEIDEECLTPEYNICLLYTSPSPRDRQKSRMPSSA